MTFTDEQIEQLAAPLERSHVKQRNQRGLNLSYIEGWHAIAEANRIFGFGEWRSELLNMTCVEQPERRDSSLVMNYAGRDRAGYIVAYTATVRVYVGDQFHDGIGYGEGIDYNSIGAAHESAVKEAATDAMKRALIHWGNPFGLALYDKAQENVTGDTAPQQPQRRSAQSEAEYGICAEHGEPYFKTGKMRSPAHRYPDPETGETKWCNKPAEKPKPTVDPEWQEAFEALTSAAKSAGWDDDAERRQMFSTLTDKKPNELSADELVAMRAHIPPKD